MNYSFVFYCNQLTQSTMNTKSLLKLGMAFLVGIGAIVSLAPASFSSESIQEQLQRSRLVVAQTALLSGEFVAAEAPTTGTAKIVDEDGQKYLEIDSAFSTNDQAPDLQILLDTVEQPPTTYEAADSTRYLNLGGIKSVTGEQRYPIPDFVDPSQFASVVVWCRTANAVMGYAPLDSNNSASIH